jgi:hypothetical protein
VTEKLLAILRMGAAANRKDLMARLWADGKCEPEALGKVKAQEELIEDLMESTADDWNEWAGHFEQLRHSAP